MSTFPVWHVEEQLRQMGWPRLKGTFRKKAYVETAVADAAVEGAVRVCVGLGSGRPELALKVLTDMFAANAWTETSVAELLRFLGQGEEKIAQSPGLRPWQALYAAHHLSPYGDHIPVEQLNNAAFFDIWGAASAQGILWGLTHEGDMPRVFAEDKERHEQAAREAISLGLDVPAQFPWMTLDQFYEGCEEFVHLFELVRPPLPQIPTALASAPKISARMASRVSG